MDYRSYRLPCTPRSVRQVGHLPDRYRPPTTPRSWHGVRDHGSSYRPRRRGRSRRTSRRGDWQQWQSQPRNRRRWNSTGKWKDTDDSRCMFGSELSPFDDDDNIWQAPGFSSQPRRIPQMISPNAREQSFTEIMNGAFDLERSPLSLGKKLAGSFNKPTPTGWSFQDPFRDESGPSLGDFIATTPTPVRPAENDLASLFAQPTRQLATHDNFRKPDVQLPSANPVGTEGFLPFPGADNDITVGVALAQNTATPSTVDFDRLFQMIQRNTAQSKELYDLLATYLKNKGRITLHGSKSSTDGSGFGSTRQLPIKDESNLAPQIATLVCGGDSPDPPRDNTNPCRGHMIDRIGDNVQSTVDASSNAHSRTQSEAGWGPSTGSSLYSQHRDNHFLYNPTLDRISDPQCLTSAQDNMLWRAIQPSRLEKSPGSTSDGSCSLAAPLGSNMDCTRPASCRSRHGFAPSPGSTPRPMTINPPNLRGVPNPSPADSLVFDRRETDSISLYSLGGRLDGFPTGLPAEPSGPGYEMQELDARSCG